MPGGHYRILIIAPRRATVSLRFVPFAERNGHFDESIIPQEPNKKMNLIAKHVNLDYPTALLPLSD